MQGFIRRAEWVRMHGSGWHGDSRQGSGISGDVLPSVGVVHT